MAICGPHRDVGTFGAEHAAAFGKPNLASFREQHVLRPPHAKPLFAVKLNLFPIEKALDVVDAQDLLKK